MRPIYKPLILALAIFSILVSFTLQDTTPISNQLEVYRLKGRVINQHGNPIIGAIISFHRTPADLANGINTDFEITGNGFNLEYPHRITESQAIISLGNQIVIKGLLHIKDPENKMFDPVTITFDGSTPYPIIKDTKNEIWIEVPPITVN